MKLATYKCLLCRKSMRGDLQTVSTGVVLVNKDNNITGVAREDNASGYQITCIQCIGKLMKSRHLEQTLKDKLAKNLKGV